MCEWTLLPDTIHNHFNTSTSLTNSISCLSTDFNLFIIIWSWNFDFCFCFTLKSTNCCSFGSNDRTEAWTEINNKKKLKRELKTHNKFNLLWHMKWCFKSIWSYFDNFKFIVNAVIIVWCIQIYGGKSWKIEFNWNEMLFWSLKNLLRCIHFLFVAVRRYYCHCLLDSHDNTRYQSTLVLVLEYPSYKKYIIFLMIFRLNQLNDFVCFRKNKFTTVFCFVNVNQQLQVLKLKRQCHWFIIVVEALVVSLFSLYSKWTDSLQFCFHVKAINIDFLQNKLKNL